MIKNKMMKVAGITAVLFVVTVLPATAKDLPSRLRGNDNREPQKNENMMNQMPLRNDHMFDEVNLLGQIDNIDSAKKIITVKDVDGVNHDVHVSDFTKINKLNKEPPARDPRQPKDDKPEVSIDDLKKGESIAVYAFETATKIMEAAKILVVEK